MALNRNDTDLLWLTKSSREKVYKQIIADTNDGKTGLATEKDLKAEARELAELIQEQGESATESIGALQHTMQEGYVARADLDPSLAGQFGLAWDGGERKYYDVTTGTYYETILTKIQADARSITESYTYAAQTVLQGNIDDLNRALIETTNLINGEIRRGFITVNGVTTFGIVISSRDVFSRAESTYRPEGETNDYYEIDTGECFGLYTATGWQFWVGKKKLGWFDSQDGQLHVDSISIDGNLHVGNWRLQNDGNTFGIKYAG